MVVFERVFQRSIEFKDGARDHVYEVDDSDFNNVSVFTLGDTVLFQRMWARKFMSYAMLGEEIFHFLIYKFTTVVGGENFNGMRELFFHQRFESTKV